MDYLDFLEARGLRGFGAIFDAGDLTPLPAPIAFNTWLNENGNGGCIFCGLLMLIFE
jgi:hypothetical protein